MATLVLTICSACLAQLAVAMGEPTYWLLPIGMVLSLPSATIHMRPLHYLVCSSLIWGTAYLLIQPTFVRPLDFTLTMMTMGATLLTGLAVCIAYQRVRKTVFELQQQLHALAYQDPLTGLPNRRAFLQGLEAAGAPRFFLMIDIDDFKNINDTLGHAAGDQMLIDVGKVLQATVPGHSLARLGGEEFAVAAHAADLAHAEQLAQRLVAAVHAIRMHGLVPSISLGLAERGAGEAAASWMQRADAALYEAKRRGKNRYAVDRADTPAATGSAPS
ncbi:GGDEF domain-containing protein [Comamonas endophytica]